ncbi:MAG: MerR family transcriptional regulator [Pseudoprimorskyibacter sp.]|nr:MerR family transcriptional regulator [Pseudoprimorskyibacter sp.]
MSKSADAFRTISEVAEWLETPTHVLRFWEGKFPQVKPTKRAGGRRYYRPSDMALLGGIKTLLREEGLTIKGVQKVLREKGIKHVAALSQPIDTYDASVPETEENRSEQTITQQTGTILPNDPAHLPMEEPPREPQTQQTNPAQDPISEETDTPQNMESSSLAEDKTDDPGAAKDAAWPSSNSIHRDLSAIEDAEILPNPPLEQADPSKAPSFLRTMKMPAPAQSEKSHTKRPDLTSDDVATQGLFGNLPKLSSSRSTSESPRPTLQQNKSNQSSFDLDLTAEEVDAAENAQHPNPAQASHTHDTVGDDPIETGYDVTKPTPPDSVRSILLSLDHLSQEQTRGLASATSALAALVERLAKPIGSASPS